MPSSGQLDPALLEKDLLRGRPDTVAIEVTSKCNLRCHYCPKADPGFDTLPHVNTDMSDEILDALYHFCKTHGTKFITLSGTGETAMTRGWHLRLRKFLNDSAFNLYLVSNFARSFFDDDLDALLKFHTIQVSFDSSDMAMVHKLRSKADLGTITYNIVRLKQKIRERGRGPNIVVNCTLLRDNIGHLADLARFCRELGVNQLLVTEMINITPQNQFDSIDKLNNNEIGLLTEQIELAKAALDGSGTDLQLQDALAVRIRQCDSRDQVEKLAPDEVERFHSSGWGSCLQPWSMPMVRSDGKVFACCIFGEHVKPVGDLTKNTMAEIFDGENYRAVRSDILAGRPSLPCDGCMLAKKMPPESFVEFVRDWL
jgi:MoaA/NifB/PqqE/SkfB family radical SAM enzyme